MKNVYGQRRMRLSLAMIVKDEAPTIARVLESAADFCDEFVVVDTGSTDRTREIALQHGAIVHDFEWIDDFAAARNTSFEHCTGDWIIWLDADDFVPPQSRSAFAVAKDALDDEVDVILAPYHFRISEDGTPLFSFNRERLIRRAAGLRWNGPVHENITIPPGRARLDPTLVVEHRPDPDRRAQNVDRNLRILEKVVASGDHSPRTLLYYANELYDHDRFTEAAEYYEQYLRGDAEGTDRYWARLLLAEARRIVGDSARATDSALRAIQEDPSRPEAYVTLGRVHFDAEGWEQAIPLFVAATAGRRPAFGFVREGDYSYAPWDFLSVCYEKLGRIHEALSAAQSAVEGNPDTERVRANLHWMIDRVTR